MSPEKKTAAKPVKKSASSGAGFTADERAAMKARAKELKDEERAAKNRAEGEKAVLEAIKKMKEPDRSLAKRVHLIVEQVAPDLWPKTWYGMPAYAKDGKVVCFFQNASKFGARYSTLGFSDQANLDDGTMWPSSYALKDLTAADEKTIAALVKKAVS